LGVGGVAAFLWFSFYAFTGSFLKIELILLFVLSTSGIGFGVYRVYSRLKLSGETESSLRDSLAQRTEELEYLYELTRAMNCSLRVEETVRSIKHEAEAISRILLDRNRADFIQGLYSGGEAVLCRTKKNGTYSQEVFQASHQP
jgi:hypothetical protein